MTPKEALKILEPFRWDDKIEIEAYELLKQSLNENEALKKDVDLYFRLMKQYVNELEELKKDLARFLELDTMLYLQGWHNKEETIEYQELRTKLSKVGKQE